MSRVTESVGGGAGPTFVLEIVESQREEISRQTGITVQSIELSRHALVACAMAADAVRGGSNLGVRSPVLVSLTPDQRRTIRDAVGLDLNELLFDPDGRDVGFHEAWSDDLPDYPLAHGLQVRWSESLQAENGDEDRMIHLLPVRDERGVFGTGLHPTTRLAAGLTEKWITRDARVADAGTGSGILAIAALRLGARSVFAFDVDEGAVDLARRNLALNGLENQAMVAVRGLDPATDGPFDFVIANIFPNVLIRMADDLARVTVANGILVISGISAGRMDDVAAAVEAAGFTTLEERTLNDWKARALRRGA